MASTPERQQDPGEHGYGGTQQEKEEDESERKHPLEDPDADPRQDDTEQRGTTTPVSRLAGHVHTTRRLN
jgi:hypothetical protein